MLNIELQIFISIWIYHIATENELQINYFSSYILKTIITIIMRIGTKQKWFWIMIVKSKKKKIQKGILVICDSMWLGGISLNIIVVISSSWGFRVVDVATVLLPYQLV